MIISGTGCKHQLTSSRLKKPNFTTTTGRPIKNNKYLKYEKNPTLKYSLAFIGKL